MAEIIKHFFTSGLTYNIVVFCLSIIAIIYTAIKDYISTKKRLPMYRIRTTQLVRSTIKDYDDIRILYKNKEIQNLASTNLIFWNRGKESIRRGDIATKNPIRITIDNEYEILGHFIIKKSSEENNFNLILSDDKKSLYVDFEYLEYNDGISIRLLHTAPLSHSLKMEGKVISGEDIERESISSLPLETLFFINPKMRIKGFRRTFEWVFRMSLIAVGAICIMVPVAAQAERRVDNSIVLNILVIVFSVIGLFYIYQGFFGFRSRVPKNLLEE